MTPGVAPTLQARARFKLLIKLLLPTLGKPVDGYFTLEKKSSFTRTQPDVRPHAKLTYDTNSDGRFYVQVTAIVAKELHQAIRTQTGAATQQLCSGLCHWNITAFLQMAREMFIKMLMRAVTC